jgi:hypothetical protein
MMRLHPADQVAIALADVPKGAMRMHLLLEQP